MWNLDFQFHLIEQIKSLDHAEPINPIDFWSFHFLETSTTKNMLFKI